MVLFRSRTISGLSPSFTGAENAAALADIIAAGRVNEIKLGKGQYDIDATAAPVLFTPGMRLVGEGPSDDPSDGTTLRFTGDAPLIMAASRTTSSSHIGGSVENLTLDGNGIARTLLEVRVSEKVEVRNVLFKGSILGTLNVYGALALMGVQNSTFDTLKFNRCLGTATLLEYGAAGNLFTGYHCTGCYEDGRLGGVHPYLSTSEGANNNHWKGGICERDTQAHDKPRSWYIGSGLQCSWESMVLSIAQDADNVNVARVVPIISIERQLSYDGVTYYSNGKHTFYNNEYQGSIDQYAADLSGSGNYGANHYKWVRAFDVQGIVVAGQLLQVFIEGKVTTTALRELVRDNTGTAGYVQVNIADNVEWSEVGGAPATERLVGTGVDSDGVRHRLTTPFQVTARTDTNASTALDIRNHSGTSIIVGKGDGSLTATGAMTAASATVTGAATVGGTLELGGTGGPQVLTGSGAPSSTPPNGSTYFRTDAGALVPNQYDRINGAWIPHRIAAQPMVFPLLRDAALSTDTTQPAGKREVLNVTRFRSGVDLTPFTQVRLQVAVVNVIGAAAAEIRLEYSTNAGGAWAYVDSAVANTGSPVSLAATGFGKVGAWVALDTAARADVLLRAVTINGDGVASPQFTGIDVQAR